MRAIPLLLCCFLAAWHPFVGAEEGSDAPAQGTDAGFSSIPDFLNKHKAVVEERNRLQQDVARISSQRAFLFWYAIGVSVLAGLCVYRLLKGEEITVPSIKREAETLDEEPVAEAPAPPPQPQTRSFRDRESSGTATITVRDGSTQRAVVTGKVATRRIVNRKITGRITNPALSQGDPVTDDAQRQGSGEYDGAKVEKPQIEMDDLDFGESDRKISK